MEWGLSARGGSFMGRNGTLGVRVSRWVSACAHDLLFSCPCISHSVVGDHWLARSHRLSLCACIRELTSRHAMQLRWMLSESIVSVSMGRKPHLMTGVRPMIAHSDHVIISSCQLTPTLTNPESSTNATSDHWGSPPLMWRVSMRSLSRGNWYMRQLLKMLRICQCKLKHRIIGRWRRMSQPVITSLPFQMLQARRTPWQCRIQRNSFRFER